MLRKNSIHLTFFSLMFLAFLAACSPETRQNAAASPTPYILQSVQARLSQTPTNSPPTATSTPVTPSPTITPTTGTPTITPTFDVASAKTATQSPHEPCPKADPEISPDFATFPADTADYKSVEEWLLNYFNQGGVAEKLITPRELIGESAENYYFSWFEIAELTNDVTPEILLSRYGRLYILGCVHGEVRIILATGPVYWGPDIFDILDMNLDGVNELVLWEYSCTFGGCIDITIHKFDGNKLVPLIYREYEIFDEVEVASYAEQYGFTISGKARIELLDVDGNGTIELVLRGGTPTNCDSNLLSSRRDEYLTYSWNGENFVLSEINFSPPEYRFQAVQDGDYYTEQGDYERALAVYQDAIFSDLLLDWSPEHWEQMMQQQQTAYCSEPKPTLQPANPATYYQVSAYARFRIMLLHLLQGLEKEAEVVYSNLVELIPSGNAGYPYVEMATAVWQSYLRDKDVSAACDEAVQYAENNPEILEPLGGLIHGRPNRISYEPQDVCPF